MADHGSGGNLPDAVHDFALRRSGNTMRKPTLIGSLGILAVILVAASGCPGGGSSAETVHLQGTVLIGGRPLPADAVGSITFSPTAIGQAGSAYSEISNGRFDVPNAPKGKVKAIVSARVPIGVSSFSGSRARPEMQFRSIVPSEKEGGIEMTVEGENRDLKIEI
jgi:hypothetical protein